MTERLMDRLRDGEWWQTVVRGPNPTGFSTDQTPTIHEAANVIEKLEAALEEFLAVFDKDALLQCDPELGAVAEKAVAALSLLRGDGK